MSNNNLNKFIPKEEALKSFKQEVLVQTNLSQQDACASCKYVTNCNKGPHNIDGKTMCSAYNGQHYPKEINTMKQELTSLPEKWCIRRNTTDNTVVTDWINKKYNKAYSDKSFADDFYHSNGSHGAELYGPEITFNQFKKWVLKENVEEIPEYVECIKLPQGWSGSTKVGGIYKTDTTGYAKGTYRILCHDYGGQTTRGVEDHFRPSTASAYNAQFKKEEPMDLLAEGKKRYPIGSKFKCVNGNKNSGYSSYNKETDTWTVTDYRLTTVNDQPAIHSDNGWLYLEGKWATIVSEAKQPEEEKWKVGGWVKCTKSYRGCEAGKYYQIKSIETKSIISVIVSKYISHMLTTTNHYQPECEWVGMNKPNELSMSDAHNWGQIDTRNHLGYLGTKGDEKPVEKEQLYNVTIKKSKVQQVEVVPLQKPCIISTKKSKFKLQIN